MAFNISYVYQATDKFSTVAKKIQKQSDKITAKIRRSSESMKSFGRSISAVGKSMILSVTTPILAVAGFALKASANIETMKVSFESLTGSAEKADKLLKKVIQFTATTPFQLEGVGKAAKQLLSFGVSQDEIISKLRFLGDIAAGANVPLSDMASIFGKSKAKGKAMTEELLQLSDRGIPIISMLAKGMGVAKEQIFDLASKGKISFEILQKSLIKMTEKGGVFFDQTKKQSQTLAGIFSTLRDNIFISLAAIGDQLVESFDLKNVLKDAITFIQQMTDRMKVFVKENPELTKTILIVTALVAALAPLLIVIGLIASGIGVLVSAVAAGFVIMFSPIGAAIALLVAFREEVGLLFEAILGLFDIKMPEWLRWLLGIGDTTIKISDDIQKIIDKSVSTTGADQSFNQGIASKALKSESTLNGVIDINAPAGVVGGATTSMKGFHTGNIGFNMPGVAQ